MKRLALLFFGISYMDNYHHWHPSKPIYQIDWKCSLDNYKQFLLSYFQKKGYQIDIYFVSNKIHESEKKKLLQVYHPISCEFIDNCSERYYSRNLKFDKVIDLCLTSKKIYDYVCITRFDLIFEKSLESCVFHDKGFHVVSQLEKPNLICDNFYYFPFSYLSSFSKLVKQNINKSFHKVKKEMEQIGPIYYLQNENVKISSLSFYKIYRVIYTNEVDRIDNHIDINKYSSFLGKNKYYAFQKHFIVKKQNNDTYITSKCETYLKRKMLHSSQLNENEKIYVSCGISYFVEGLIDNYFILEI